MTDVTPLPGAVDMHAHLWPRGLVEAAWAGRSWYGYEPSHTPEGKLVIGYGGRIVPLAVPTVDDIDPENRIAKKASLSIEMEAVMPAGMLWNYDLPAAAAADSCREMNHELADMQRSYPANFRALATVPMQDEKRAIAEVDFCVDTLGLRNFAVGSAVNGANLDDPTVIPVLDHMASRGCSFNVHPQYWEKLGLERFPRHLFGTSLGTHFEAALTTASLICSGILDRYPQARIGVTHGAGSLQFAIGRLDAVYRLRPATRTTEEPPSAYLRRLYYDCLVHDEKSLQLLLARVGTDRVVVGTDFPFDWDSPGGSANWLASLDFLTDEDKRLMLAGNARRFLGIEQPAG